jgi:hypothetical protein
MSDMAQERTFADVGAMSASTPGATSSWDRTVGVA